MNTRMVSSTDCAQIILKSKYFKGSDSVWLSSGEVENAIYNNGRRVKLFTKNITHNPAYAYYSKDCKAMIPYGLD